MHPRRWPGPVVIKVDHDSEPAAEHLAPERIGILEAKCVFDDVPVVSAPEGRLKDFALR
jgi:hypothetical protein